MRALTLGLALAVLVARPAGAGRMLYATAASDNRIDGFCIRDDGSLAPTPAVSIATSSTQPRRLVVVDDVLYAVEVDRVEAFQIGAKGQLSLLGRTPKQERSGARDVAISTNRTMLYVPDRSRSRIVGRTLPLPRDGGPAQDFPTCIQGPIGASYQNLIATSDKLYVSSSGGNGRIEVFGIDADGNLFGKDENGSTVFPTPSDCKGATADAPRPAATLPLSERRKIADVKSFVIANDLLYAEDRGRHRIRAFRLDDGNLPPETCEVDKNPVACTDDNKPYKKKWQKAASKTKRVAQYQQILHYGSAPGALIATQFFHGRIDWYALKSDGQLTKRPKESTADLRYTPVRLTTDQDVVYVAAGEFDRILAYRLRADGVAKDPFSQTEEQEGSFPNDVAVAMLTAGCGS